MQFISKANNRKWPDLQINDRWEFSKIFAGFSFYKTPFLWKRIHWPDLFLGIINEWESPCFQIQVFPGRWLSFFLSYFSHRLGEKYFSHRLGHFNYIGCISWAVISELGSSFVLTKKSFVNSVFLAECKWIIWEIEILPVIPVAFLETKIRDKKNENYAIWPNSSHSAVPSFPIKLSSWLKLFGGRIECIETFRQTFNIHIISIEIHSDWFVELKSFSNMSLYDLVFTFCCSFYSLYLFRDQKNISDHVFLCLAASSMPLLVFWVYFNCFHKDTTWNGGNGICCNSSSLCLLLLQMNPDSHRQGARLKND